MKPWNFAIKHPAIIAILLVTVILFGGISLMSLKQDLITNIALPQIAVFTIYPGAGPEDVEQGVTDVLEERFASIQGIDSLESFSQNSLSMVILIFNPEADLNQKINEVRAEINASMASLPENISGMPIAVIMSSNLYPIFSVQVESTMNRTVLTDYVQEKVIPLINRVEGVSTAQLIGLSERQLDIVIDLEKLESRNISILDIYQLLRYNNLTFPSGSVSYRDKKLNVRTAGNFKTINDIGEMVVGYKEEERSFILLKDIATIKIVEKKPDHYAEFGGQSVLVLDVTKKSDGDSLAIIDEIKEVFRKVTLDTNGAVSFTPVIDSSFDVGLAVSSVKDSAVQGAILAILVIFFFLHNIRATFIIGSTIPLSVVMAFIFMRFANLDINIITLGGLTVAIGMMVDSAIVILENTYNHFDRLGDRKEAASIGAGEVGGAILASTSTSLAVFIPILFLTGLVGAILKDVSLTICFALAASTIVSVVIVPWMCSLMLKHPNLEETGRFGKFYTRVSTGIDKGIDKVRDGYVVALEWAIGNKKFIAVVMILILILSGLLFLLLGFTFIPSTDMNEFQIEVTAPSGFSLEQTREKMREIESIVTELVPEIDSGYYYTGLSGSYDVVYVPKKGFAKLRLQRKSERPEVDGKVRSVQDVILLLQNEIPARVTDVNVVVSNGGIDKMMSYATGGAGLVVEVFGEDFDDVLQSAVTVSEILGKDPGIYKTGMNVVTTEYEVINELTLRYLNYLGITPFEAGVTSRIIFNGMEVGQFNEDGKNYSINLVSNVAGEKITDDILNKIRIKNRQDQFISFENISQMRIEKTVDQIPHIDRMKSIVVTGYQRDPDVKAIGDRFRAQMDQTVLPGDVQWKIGGSSELLTSSLDSLVKVLLIAVYLVYVVMVIQFERFVQPFIILASIPFVVIGVALSLFLTGTQISLVSMLGIIALAGTVVNNAIVLVDYTNLLRTDYNMGLMEAVIKGAKSRFKPIMMTTLTTILGVIPMIFGGGEGAEIYAPLGLVIGGGLVTSTAVTLFIIPILYSVVERKTENRKKGKEISVSGEAK